MVCYRNYSLYGNGFGGYEDNWSFDRNSDFDKYLVNNEKPNYWISAPLIQQAFEFFRKQYKLFSYVIHFSSDDTYGWKIDDNISNLEFTDGYINSYEEAELDCLKKMIKIINANK